MADAAAAGSGGDAAEADLRRLKRVPMGLLFVPFALGTAAILLVGWAIERSITLQWLALGFVVGATFSVLAVVSAMRRRHSPVRLRHAGARGEADRKARASDPLGHIQAAEAETRRYRRPCVNCGTQVSVSKTECPACGHAQVHPCKKCGTPIRPEWDHCPECGTSFHL